MKNFLKVSAFLAALLFSAPALALCGTGTGTCFWIGGGSSTAWSATTPSNWAATSGGVATTTVAAGDAVVFDANSGTGASVLSASLSVSSFDASASSAVPLTINTAVVLTDSGTVFKVGSNMTFTSTGTASLAFTAASGTVVIDTLGKVMPAAVMGASGTSTAAWQLASALSVTNAATSTLTLTSGTLDLNANALTTRVLSTNNSNTRQINLSGNMTVGQTASTSTAFDATTATGLTISTTGGGSMTLAALTCATCTTTFAGGGKTYNGLIIGGGPGLYTFTGANTWGQLSASAQVNIRCVPASIQTYSGGIALTGTSSTPIFMFSGSPGTTCSVPFTGASTATWASIRDISFSSASNFTATNSANLGDNTISGGGTLSITAPSGGGGGGHIIGG